MCHKHQSQIERDLKDPHLSDDITVTVDCGFQDWGSLVLGGQGSCLLLYGEESMKVNRVFFGFNPGRLPGGGVFLFVCF